MSDSTASLFLASDILPATPAQREVWTGQDLQPDSDIYHISTYTDLRGEVNIPLLASIVEQAVSSCEAISVEFIRSNHPDLAAGPHADPSGIVVGQRVRDLSGFRVPVLRFENEEASNAWFDADLVDSARRGQQSLFRHVIAEVAPGHIRWMVRYHHSIMDGIGAALILAEVARRYTELSATVASPTQNITPDHSELLQSPEHPWSIHEHAHLRYEATVLGDNPQWPLAPVLSEQAEYEASPGYDQDREFWTSTLDGAPEPTPLLDPLPSATSTSHAYSYDVLQPEEFAKFSQAAQGKVAPSLMAASAAYFARSTGQRDVVIAMPVTGRSTLAFFITPCMASNIVPLRLQISPTDSVRDIATQLRATLKAALPHSRYRGENILRDTGTPGLVRAGVNVLIVPAFPQFGDAEVDVDVPRLGPSGDMQLAMVGTAESKLGFEARTNTSDPVAAKIHTHCFGSWLRQVTEAFDAPIGSLPLASPQRAKELAALGEGPRTDAYTATLSELVVQASERWSEHEALKYTHQSQMHSLSYQQAFGAAHSITQRISEQVPHRAHPATDDVVIGIACSRGPEMILGLWACLLGGYPFVPLDPQWPAARIAAVATEAGCGLIVTTADIRIDTDVPTYQLGSVQEYAAAEYASVPQLAQQVTARHADALAYIIFTSGSTGTPKGAMIRQSAIAERLLWQRDDIIGFTDTDRSLFKAPLAFDISINEIFLPLISGGAVVIASDQQQHEPVELASLITQGEVSFGYFVPSMLSAILDCAEHMGSLKHLWCGGEALSTALARRISSSLDATLYHGYGPAETTIGVSHVVYQDASQRSFTSIGSPNPNTTLLVLDPHLQPVEMGITGELYVAGSMLGRGYANAAAVTAHNFVANPYGQSGERMYRTGDLVRYAPNGELEFRGRSDDQIKIRGMRVDLEEIEAALARVPSISQATCDVRPSVTGHDRVIVWVVDSTRPVEQLTEDKEYSHQIGQQLRELLAEHMIPSRVLIVPTIPVTPNGKINKKALQEPHASTSDYTDEQRDESQELLCEVFAGVLGVDAHSFSIHDDFIELGGDSIMALSVVAKLRQAGFNVTAKNVLALRTSSAIAASSQRVDHSQLQLAKIAAEHPGKTPLAPLAHYMLQRADHLNDFIHTASFSLPDAGMSDAAIEGAVSMLLYRHPVLAASVNYATGELDIPDAITASQKAHSYCADGAMIDPERGSMMSVQRSGDDITWSISHLVVDGVSWRVILTQFATDLSHDIHGGNLAELESSSDASFKGFSDAFAQLPADIHYWRNFCDQAQRTAVAPAVIPAGLTAAHYRHAQCTIAAGVVQQLQRVAVEHHTDLATVLLTIVVASLQSPSSHVCVDVESHGRDDQPAHIDTSATVGWLTSLNPVMLAADATDFSTHLVSVHSSLAIDAPHYLAAALADSQIARRAPSAILFNHLGTLNDAVSFTATRPATAAAHYLWEVDTMLVDDQLHLSVHAVSCTAQAQQPADTALARIVHTLNDAATCTRTAPPRASDSRVHADLTDEEIAQLCADTGDITGGHISSIHMLTPTQHAMHASWMASELNNETDPYVVVHELHISGSITLDDITERITTLIQQHPALRTGFYRTDDTTVAISYTHSSPEIRLHPMGSDPAAIIATERATRFDSGAPSLARWSITRTGTGWFITQTVHHLIADGWSIPIVVAGLFGHHTEANASEHWARHLHHHLRQPGTLTGATTELAEHLAEHQPLVLADYCVSEGHHSGTELVTTECGVDLAAAARACGVTPSAFIHAAWTMTLAHITGREDLIIASTSAGRSAELPFMQSTVGMFITTLPHGVHITPQTTISQLAHTFMDLLAPDAATDLIDMAAIHRLTGHRQLADHSIVVENYPLDPALAIDSRGEQYAVLEHVDIHENAGLALTMVVVPAENTQLRLRIDPARIHPGFAGALAATFARVLENAQPEHTLSDIAQPTPATISTLPATGQVPQQTIGVTIAQACQRYADHIAIADDTTSLTYAQLDHAARVLAPQLVNQPAVLVALPRSTDHLIASLACFYAGAAYVGIDSDIPTERIATIAANTGATHCIATQASNLPGSLTVITPDSPGQAATDSDLPGLSAHPGSTCYIMHTSGSTGTPKAVAVSHHALMHRLHWAAHAHNITTSDVIAHKTSITFDVSMWELTLGLICGARIVAAAHNAHKDPHALGQFITSHNITMMHFVPSMLSAYTGYHSGATFPSVRELVCSGEALTGELSRSAHTIFPNARIVNLYGPTEAAIDVTMHTVDTRSPAANVALGAAVPETRLLVLDSRLQPVGPYIPGELYISGPQLALGYLNAPDTTATTFLPAPDGGRMYRTGDIVHIDSTGNLHYHARRDDQVKIRGMRVELGEVQALIDSHPDVHASCVLADKQGNSTHLHAFVHSQRDATELTPAVQAHILTRAPGAYVPQHVHVLTSLPVTANGKRDTAALTALIPTAVASEAGAKPVSHSADVDSVRTTIASVLGIDTLGADTDFYAAGGDSISALRVVTALRAQGHQITPQEFMQAPTATAIAAASGMTITPQHTAEIVRIDDTDAQHVDQVMLPPSYQQLASLSGPLHGYGQVAVVNAPTQLDLDVLKRALSLVCEHHAALRYRLREDLSIWQLDAERGGENCAVSRAVNSSVQQVADECSDQLDPYAGPVIVATSVASKIVFAAHHIAVDAVSWQVIIQDIAAAYTALSLGNAVSLTPAGPSPAHLARLLAADTALHHTPQDWQLPSGREVVKFPSTARTTSSMVTCDVHIGDAQLVQGHYRPESVLAAVIHHSVCQVQSIKPSQILPVMCEGHGREDTWQNTDFSSSVGWFTAFYPLHVYAQDTSENTSIISAVEHCQQQLSQISAHTYGQLAYLNPLVDITPVQPEILVNYLGRLVTEHSDAPWHPTDTDVFLRPHAQMSTPYALVVNAAVVDGQLRAMIAADSDVFSAQQLQQLAGALSHGAGLLHEHMTAMVDTHSVSSAYDSSGALGGISPLTALQSGMALASMRGDDPYTAHFWLDSTRRIDADQAASAADAMMAAYPILRSKAVLRRDIRTLTESRSKDAALLFTPHHNTAPIQVVSVDDAQLEQATQDVKQHRISAFDDCLWRLTIISTPSCDRLVVSRHFMLWDGWSNASFISALLGLLFDEEHKLNVQPAAAYAPFEHAATNHAELLPKWQRYLDGVEPTLIARSGAQDPGTATVITHRFSAEESAQFNTALTAHGFTVAEAASAAISLTLQSLGLGDTVVHGVTVSGRDNLSLAAQDTIGSFVNTIPVAVNLRPGETGAHLIARIRQERASIMGATSVSLADITTASGHSSLFDVLVVTQNFIDPHAGDMLSQRYGITGAGSEDHTEYPLTIVITPGEEIAVLWEVRENLVDPARAHTARAVFMNVLRELILTPEKEVHRIGDTELPYSQTLASASAQADADLMDLTVAELLSRQATLTPHAAAFTHQDTTVSFAELDASINAMARLLISRGAGVETVVALGLGRTLDMVVALFAVLRTGAAYLPLELDNPPARLARLCSLASPHIIVTSEDMAKQLTEHQPHLSGALACLDSPDLAAELAQQRTEALTDEELSDFAPSTPNRLEHPAYIIFTSGSTGEPKGVVTPYRGLTNMLLNHRAEIFASTIEHVAAARPESPQVRVAHTVSFAFDMSWEELFWAVEGHHVHICDEQLRADAPELVKYLHTHHVDVINVTPTYAEALLSVGLGEEGTPTPPLVLLGGEAVSATVWEELDARGIHAYNLYGPTEYTINALGGGTRDSATPTVGNPILGTDAYLLDEWLREVPQGCPGELYIGGVGMARGYLNRPDLTAVSFIPHLHTPGAVLYRTGDIMIQRPDGLYDYLGRSDGQTKIRGHRIEPVEIAAEICRHPRVDQAVCVVDTSGAYAALNAYVVGEAAEPADIKTWLVDKLPSYMVPSYIVVIDSLPMTVNGKLDTAALPTPQATRGSGREPQGYWEELVATHFCEVLGLERVGVEDHFLDMGGHSLLATRVIAALSVEENIELSVRDLLTKPTVAQLAHHIQHHRQEHVATLVHQPESTTLASAAQHRLWIIDSLTGPSAGYNFPLILPVEATDVPFVADALADVIAKHVTLRSQFELRGGPAYTHIRPLSPADAIAMLHADMSSPVAVENFFTTPFDLENGLPLRARLNTDNTLLMVCLHHIVTDEWSDQVFITDFHTALGQRRAGESYGLAPATPNYLDFARWQHQRLGTFAHPTPHAQNLMSWWTAHLDQAPVELDTAADYPRPLHPTGAGHRIRLTLPERIVRSVRDYATTHRTTHFALIHAAVCALLARVGSHDDVVVGVPVAGRDNAQLAQIVGLFVNTIPTRVRVQPQMDTRELIATCNAALLDGIHHSELPFDTIVSAVNPPRVHGRNPLMQTTVAHHVVPEELLGDPVYDTPEDYSFLHTNTSKFDASYTLYESATDSARMELVVEYSTELYSRDWAESMLSRVQLILEHITADGTLGQLPLRLETDQYPPQQLEVAPYSPQRCEELFADSVRRAPEQIALIDAQRRYTYSELDHAARMLAAHLVNIDSAPIVGVHTQRSAEFVIATLATWMAGGSIVSLDPRHPAHRRERIISASGCHVVLDEDRITEILSLNEAVLEHNRGGSVDEAAYVLFTSGSTGEPKGVVSTHQGASALVETAKQRMNLICGSTVLQFASIGFDVVIFELLQAMATASTLVILPEELKLPSHEFANYLLQQHITHAIIPPSFMAALPDDVVLPENLTVLVGTEAVSADLVNRFTSRIDLLVAYGLTEATVNSTLWRTERASSSSVPIGISDPFTRSYVLDEFLQPVAPGVLGELYVGGEGLASYYVAAPDITALRFIPDPFTGGRMYRTGDKVRYDYQGLLHFVGRDDHQIKINGFRIEPAEIVAALNSLPAVRQAVLDIVKEPTPSIVAFIEPAGKDFAVGSGSSSLELRRQLAALLPAYMIPAEFVILPEGLPVNTNGKIDRSALHRPTHSAAALQPPHTDAEILIAKLMSEVCGGLTLHRHSNFFEHGGSSLAAMQLVVALRQVGFEQATVRDVFDKPVVSELAEHLEHSDDLQHVQVVDQLEFARQQYQARYQAGRNGGRYDHVLAIRRDHSELAPLDPALLATAVGAVFQQYPQLAGGATSQAAQLEILSDSDPDRFAAQIAQRGYDPAVDCGLQVSMVNAEHASVIVLAMSSLHIDPWSVVPLTATLVSALTDSAAPAVEIVHQLHARQTPQISHISYRGETVNATAAPQVAMGELVVIPLQNVQAVAAELSVSVNIAIQAALVNALGQHPGVYRAGLSEQIAIDTLVSGRGESDHDIAGYASWDTTTISTAGEDMNACASRLSAAMATELDHRLGGKSSYVADKLADLAITAHVADDLSAVTNHLGVFYPVSTGCVDYPVSVSYYVLPTELHVQVQYREDLVDGELLEQVVHMFQHTFR